MPFDFQEMMLAWVTGECNRFERGSEEEAQFKAWWDKLTTVSEEDANALTRNKNAVDYLCFLKENGNVSIETAKGFNIALKRHLRGNSKTDSDEIWDVCNKALKELDAKGKIQLVQRSRGYAHNSDVWVLKANLRDANRKYSEGILDTGDTKPDDLKGVARSLWHLTVIKERRVHGVRSNGRLVSPSEAPRFLFGVFYHYHQAMTMGLLNEAIGINNPIIRINLINGGPEGGGDNAYNPINSAVASGLSPRVQRFIQIESIRRGTDLGIDLCAEKLCAVFVEYFLVKELRDGKAVLEGIGNATAQRNNERVEEIRKLIPIYLPLIECPDAFVPDEVAHGDAPHSKEQFADNMATVRVEIFKQTLEIAGTFCTEKCGN